MKRIINSNVIVFIVYLAISIQLINVRALSTKEINQTEISEPDDITNVSLPILQPVRETINRPYPLSQKQWQWYQWTRSKYHVGKHNRGLKPNVCDVNETSSLDDFPDDLFTQEQRQNGAVILHFLGAIYFFTISGVVIDSYFIPSVQCICDDLKITPDVGAAVFMATATATPELFTNLISTFVTDSDMGVGTVIGSLMFNILGVTALSSLLIRAPLQMDWWPLTRDCAMFTFNVAFLLWFAWDGLIHLWESCLLLILIVFYYVVMFNSARLSKFMKRKFEVEYRWCNRNNYDLKPANCGEQRRKSTCVYIVTADDIKQKEIVPENKSNGLQNGEVLEAVPSMTKNSLTNSHANTTKNAMNVEDVMSKREVLTLWQVPRNSIIGTFWWFYSWPIRFVLAMTLPNPRTRRRFYVATFLLCIVWIGVVAYLIFWMLVVIGHTFTIPESILGLTILAVGGCTPEVITGAIMARNGQAGIGIANSLGASSLAILLSLGLPWFIKVVLLKADGHPGVVSVAQGDGVTYTIASLLFVSLALYAVVASFKFILRRITSVFLFFCYGVFISFAVLVELEVLFPSDSIC